MQYSLGVVVLLWKTKIETVHGLLSANSSFMGTCKPITKYKKTQSEIDKLLIFRQIKLNYLNI